MRRVDATVRGDKNKTEKVVIQLGHYISFSHLKFSLHILLNVNEWKRVFYNHNKSVENISEYKSRTHDKRCITTSSGLVTNVDIGELNNQQQQKSRIRNPISSKLSSCKKKVLTSQKR